MKHFGLDIGASSIKVAWLDGKPERPKLIAMGEEKNLAGSSLDSETSLIKTSEAIKKLVGELEINTNLVVTALPENKVISRLISFPPINEAEIGKALYYETETFVPYPKDKVQLDYQIVEQTKDKILVFVVAAHKEIVEKIQKLVKTAGFVPVALETTSISLVRSLAPKTGAPTMIVDLGASNSVITVVKNGGIYISRVIGLGGNAFTRAISTTLGMDFLKAEEYKKAYGFQAGSWESKIRNALIDVFDHLAEELKKVALSYSEEWNERIELLILSGGGAITPGLTDELIKVLGVEIQIAQPLAGMDIKGARTVSVDQKDYSRYSIPIGLAKREK
jgi:type IV pilus assembly protein PilM